MDNIAFPLIILGLVGGFLSHYMAKRRLAREARKWASIHTTAMTAIADAAVEVMTIDGGMDIRVAQTRLLEEAQKRVPTIVGLPAQGTEEALAKAQKYVDKKRAERAIALTKEPTDGTKKD